MNESEFKQLTGMTFDEGSVYLAEFEGWTDLILYNPRLVVGVPPGGGVRGRVDEYHKCLNAMARVEDRIKEDPKLAGEHLKIVDKMACQNYMKKNTTGLPDFATVILQYAFYAPAPIRFAAAILAIKGGE